MRESYIINGQRISATSLAQARFAATRLESKPRGSKVIFEEAINDLITEIHKAREFTGWRGE